jgi:hypothetical protein
VQTPIHNFGPFRRGATTPIAELRRIGELARRTERITTDGAESVVGESGIAIRTRPEDGFWATVLQTAPGSSAYGFVEMQLGQAPAAGLIPGSPYSQIANPEGVPSLVIKPGGITGGIATELHGDKSVPDGSLVWMRSSGPQEWVFEYVRLEFWARITATFAARPGFYSFPEVVESTTPGVWTTPTNPIVGSADPTLINAGWPAIEANLNPSVPVGAVVKMRLGAFGQNWRFQAPGGGGSTPVRSFVGCRLTMIGFTGASPGSPSGQVEWGAPTAIPGNGFSSDISYDTGGFYTNPFVLTAPADGYYSISYSLGMYTGGGGSFTGSGEYWITSRLNILQSGSFTPPDVYGSSQQFTIPPPSLQVMLPVLSSSTVLFLPKLAQVSLFFLPSWQPVLGDFALWASSISMTKLG